MQLFRTVYGERQATPDFFKPWPKQYSGWLLPPNWSLLIISTLSRLPPTSYPRVLSRQSGWWSTAAGFHPAAAAFH